MTSCVLNADSGLYDGTFISHTATGLFRYILFEKYVYILAAEGQGTSAVRIVSAYFRSIGLQAHCSARLCLCDDSALYARMSNATLTFSLTY